MEGINLRKLAEKLNLSISTVSKAFQDTYDINPQTRERVLALAKELNYQPNLYASSLRKQQSKTIAVVLPQIANNFFTQAIDGIESVAREQGFHVLFYLTHEDHEKEAAFIREIQNGRVDGILLSTSDNTHSDDHLLQLRSSKIPLVFFDRVYNSAADARVITNNKESSYEGTTHLIDQGCQKIGHLYYAQHLSISTARIDGYRDALADAGIPFRKELLLDCEGDSSKTVQSIRNFMQQQRPDGIFSSFEKLALHCYTACREINISIPGGMKVLSYSNLEIATLLDPPLTTITQPAYEIGREAALMLFKLISKELNEHKTLVIPSVLCKRRSTDKD